MTTLLLTDIPPCSNFPAGIVTSEMCRAVQPDPLAIFCVLNRHLSPVLYDDLADIPLTIVTKPNEVGVRKYRGIKWGTPGAVSVEFLKRFLALPRLIRQAVEFGRSHGAIRLWAVLQGQTMVRMALPVAQGLGVPLHLHVWDPLRWWHQAHLVDRVNAWLDQKTFDKTMRAGVCCASASWAMTEAFAEQYGVSGEPVIASLDSSWCRRPEPRLHTDDQLVIGMAGQFYAEREWYNLLQALSIANWQVNGRRVILRVMGRDRPPGSIPDENLDFLGWRSQQEVIQTLSKACDVLYCGYPFDLVMADVSRLSFPSKLPTFFCAGRPVLFHGPADSSPGVYLKRRDAAWIADQPVDAVYNGLVHLVEDEALYMRLSRASTQAFLADFTLARQRAAVRRFLHLPEDKLRREPGTRFSAAG